MSKHTPGPWRVDAAHAEEIGLSVLAGDRWICGEIDNDPDKMPIELGCHHGMTPQQVFAMQTENAANACLIAAAPDLLRLLVACSHALKSYAHGNTAVDLASSVAHDADEVIARALGLHERSGGTV